MITMENNTVPNTPEPAEKNHSISFHIILGASLLAFIETFSLLAPILLSFLLILLISLAVNPVISRIRSWTGGRKGAAGLLVAATVVLIVLTGWAFFGPMKTSIINLTAELPEYWERFQKPLIKMEQQAVLFEKKLQAEVTSEIARTEASEGRPVVTARTTKSAPPEAANESESIRSRLSEMLQGVVGTFTAMAFNAGQMLVILVTVFFGVCFTIMNPRPILGSMFSLVPERHHGKALIIMQRIGNFAPNWAATTLLGMVTIGLLVFLIMLPIFGFMDALVLGLIAGILEAVPYLGPTLGAVPALLLAFGIGGMTPMWVFLAYIGVQALENNIITPYIMARGMKLHPVAVIFSMLLCVAAFGVVGVLVAAPLVAVVDILHDELYRKRFLPTVTDEDLHHLARRTLREKMSVSN